MGCSASCDEREGGSNVPSPTHRHPLGCSRACEAELEGAQPEEPPFGGTPDAELLLQDRPWDRLGGKELEEPIKKDWVRPLRAGYIVQLARCGGLLQRRQEMPEEAFISLEELKKVEPGTVEYIDQTQLVSHEWLPIVVVSYPWLHPAHPDPFGETLAVLGDVCRLLPEDHGIILDYTALHQVQRSPEEEVVFRLGLHSLSLFFSHPRTLVLKVTSFPEGYPSGKHRYDLPQGANVAAYRDRGWTYAESAMSSLTKDGWLCWDLSEFRHQLDFIGNLLACQCSRVPPLDRAHFRMYLARKSFLQPEMDYELAQELYETAYVHRIRQATTLQFSGFGWGPVDAQTLFGALSESKDLHSLNLSCNCFGDEGAQVVGEALCLSSNLKQLRLQRNEICHAGAIALAEALRSNTNLRELHLGCNHLADTGATALAAALQSNASLHLLDLFGNGVQDRGAQALAEALAGRGALRDLLLGSNRIGDAGARALASALCRGAALRELRLISNRIGAAGAQALAEAGQSSSCVILYDQVLDSSDEGSL